MANQIQVIAIVVWALLMAGSCNGHAEPTAAEIELQQSLARAAWRHDTGRITELVAEGADLAALIAGEGPALIFDAARKDNSAMVALLLDNGMPADLRTEPYTNHLGQTVPAGRPLAFTAAEHGSRDVLSLLFERGVGVDTRDDHGLTLLHLAYSNGQYATASLLMEFGADPQARTNLGHTCREFELFHVARINSAMEVRQVLGNGADPNVAFAPGQTVLSECGTQTPQVVALLLEAGANPNVQDQNGISPLHQAINCGQTETVELLLAAGADPGSPDSSGRTPLILASESLGGAKASIILALQNAGGDH